LELDENKNIRISTVGSNEMGPGGGIQYEIREPSLKDDVNDLNQDDYPGTFEVDKSRDNLQAIIEEALE
jgi:hypothetical protein